MFKKFFSDSKSSSKNKNYDSFTLIVIFILLLLIGFFIILSCAPDYKYLFSTINKDPSYFRFAKHILHHTFFIFIGLATFILTGLLINYKKYQKVFNFPTPLILYIITTTLLVMPFFFAAHKGAHRWINLKIFSFQPSELAKIALIIVLADFLSRKQKYINDLKYQIVPAAYFLIFALIIFFQKDFGTFILLALTYITMFFVAGIDYKKIFAAFAGLISVSAVLIMLFPYRLKRILDFANSIFDMSAASYNIKLSLVAFGSGGLFGKGPGNSEMKLEHLPERHTDFIFPIIGEEYGFLGTMLVIFLFVMLMKTGMSISKNCTDDFGKYLALGITITMTLQVLINMAMTTNLIPAKGLPLPFISYGGSSMLISCLMLGVLFNVSRSQYIKNEK